MFKRNRKQRTNNEQGLALLMTIFVLALASMLVMDLAYRMRFDARASRAYSEGVQAEFILKSTLNLARILLEMPKLDGIQEDWLGEPWALIGSAPTLPVSGFRGDARLMIVDEEGKIDINAILERTNQNQTSLQPTSGQTNQLGGTTGNDAGALNSSDLFWKNSLRELFLNAGFSDEIYNPDLFRTPGNAAYNAGKQVAIIHDWIDSDNQSYNNVAFDGEGIEAGADKSMFYNRALKGLSELLLVPGMTSERVSQIAPFIRVSGSHQGVVRRINVNTAPLEVLQAVGFADSQATELIQQRLNLPITKEMLDTLVAGDTVLQKHTKVTSSEFSIISRVSLPSTTKWLYAIVTTRGSRGRRTTRIQSVEFY